MQPEKSKVGVDGDSIAKHNSKYKFGNNEVDDSKVDSSEIGNNKVAKEKKSLKNVEV